MTVALGSSFLKPPSAPHTLWQADEVAVPPYLRHARPEGTHILSLLRCRHRHDLRPTYRIFSLLLSVTLTVPLNTCSRHRLQQRPHRSSPCQRIFLITLVGFPSTVGPLRPRGSKTSSLNIPLCVELYSVPPQFAAVTFVRFVRPPGRLE
jgi:hypothetical protein